MPRVPLALLAAAFLLLILASISGGGEINRGVRVGEVDLGGMTRAQARAALEAETAVLLEGMRVVAPGGISFTAGQMGVGLDAAETVERAYALGREGGIPARLRDKLGPLLIGTSVTPEAAYDPRAVQEKLKPLAAALQVETREAGVRVTGGEAEVVEAREGRSIDIAATVEGVVGAVRDGRTEAEAVVRDVRPRVSTVQAREAGAIVEGALSGPVTFTSGGDEWAVSPEEIGRALQAAPEGEKLRVSLDPGQLANILDGAYAALTVEPVQAGFVVEGGEIAVREGRSGRRIDEERLLAALDGALLQGGGSVRSFELPVETAHPELTAAEAHEARPTEIIGSYRTNYMTYDDGPGRVANLEIASGAIDETVLAPGEVFSFNELTEPLDYYATSVIVNGSVDTADGGGLCQVASTLYVAANHAGLKVLERHPHYAELPYIRPGLDATVWFGDLDMKFRNTTDDYLLLREWVDREGYVNAEIWGRPTGKKVEMNSRLVSTSLDSEGNPVTEWVTYKKVEKNGKVVSDGPIHRDTYGFLKP